MKWNVALSQFSVQVIKINSKRMGVRLVVGFCIFFCECETHIGSMSGCWDLFWTLDPSPEGERGPIWSWETGKTHEKCQAKGRYGLITESARAKSAQCENRTESRGRWCARQHHPWTLSLFFAFRWKVIIHAGVCQLILCSINRHYTGNWMERQVHTTMPYLWYTHKVH